MTNPWIVRRPAALLATAAVIGACGDDGGTPSQPTTPVAYSEVQATLTADCSGCHGLGTSHVFTTTYDSAQLEHSGFVDPSNPDQSLIIVKPSGAAPHGGGIITTFTAANQDLIKRWVDLLPVSTAQALSAIKIGGSTGLTAPVIDGVSDPVWDQAPSTSYTISGGWADATQVTMRATYDESYLYLQVVWTDDALSNRRIPWVKQADGSWATLHEKTPLPTPGTSWETYEHSFGNPELREEDHTHFNYEDKLAIMWNTYGPGTVAGFETSGCAVTCHDPSPAHHGGPGTTYNYVDENLAAKKYTNTPDEVADLWHWKLVRNNQHVKLDDQYVGYWAPNTGGEEDAGRHGDAGASGYATNPAINGHPTYKGPSTTAPPYYIFDGEKVPLTDDEASALPIGTEIANMITSGPTGARADIDAFGVYDAANKKWMLEIRRLLVTPDATTDVEFDDLTRQYAFGVAIFDDAQIEHSYTPMVGRLVFKP
jgi:hypothetical protein